MTHSSTVFYFKIYNSTVYLSHLKDLFTVLFAGYYL